MKRVALSLLLLGGCSAERQIATSSTSIGALAHSSKGRFVEIVSQTDSAKPDLIIIREQATAGAGEQEQIVDAVAAIVASLPGVSDVTPWWAEMLARVLVAVALVALAALFLRSGIVELVASWLKQFRAPDRKRQR